MNKNIDLTKILEGCPKGTKFYSSIWGTVTFIGIVDNMIYPIRIKSYNKTNGEGQTQSLTKDGRYYCAYDGECIFFPSKDQRDWSKFERFWDKPKVERFNPKTLQPFDKVIVRYYNDKEWSVNLFSHFLAIKETKGVVACGSFFKYCIPYNDETKHLVGTTDEEPEYYRYWDECYEND